MSWKTAHRSFYYKGAPEPADPILRPGKEALLVAGRYRRDVY